MLYFVTKYHEAVKHLQWEKVIFKKLRFLREYVFVMLVYVSLMLCNLIAAYFFRELFLKIQMCLFSAPDWYKNCIQ